LSESFLALIGNLSSGSSALLKTFFCDNIVLHFYLNSFFNVLPVIVVFKFHIQNKKSVQTNLDDVELVNVHGK